VAVIYAVYGGDSTHLASRSRGIEVSINGGTSIATAVRPDISQLPRLQVPQVPVLVPVVPSITAVLTES